MVACGQMATHFKHWMHVFSSHTGISSARLRFSYCAVPVGNEPSFGNALTGSSSPSPAGDLAEHVAHKLRRVRRDRRQQRAGAVQLCGPPPTTSCRLRQRVVHGLQIHLDDFIALFAVGFLDGIFDRVNRLVLRQHAGEREEADLHDGVDASAHAAFARDLGGVDDVELRLLREQRLLHRRRQRGPDFVLASAACSAGTCRRTPGCGAFRSVRGTPADGTRRNSRW